jgi:uncharacterized membrane protein
MSLPQHVQHNIERVAQLRAGHGGNRHDRRIHRLTSALGRPRTFYVLLGFVAAWIAINVYALATGRAPIDEPPFFWLQGAMSLYAGIIGTLVFVRQARQTRDADRRAHLELQVNLLAEQKATKIIALLEELRRDLPDVRDRADSEADALQMSVDPSLVDSALRK